uniref:RING-box protein 2 n=1 Tax=Apis cerana TaxID=7461 RepID=V9IFG5_APICE
MADSEQDFGDRGDNDNLKTDKLFILKKWNAVAMWSWDVECDTCAICRVQVMDACLRCQAESKKMIVDRIVSSSGENAIIHFIIVACHFGCNRIIVVHYASKNGPFNEWENN